MCEWGDNTMVEVTIPEDLSCTGEERIKACAIDSCIAPIVEALERGGIKMRGSCCGHNRGVGDIHLQDGRMLIILDPKTTNRYLKNRSKINPGIIIT